MLSHHSAGAAHGVLRSDRGRVDVTVASRGGRTRMNGIAVHRPRRPLRPDEWTVVDGIPVTTLARTLADLAGSCDATTIARALERAEQLRTLDVGPILAAIAERPGRRSARVLAEALERFDPAPTRSELERMFLALCREHAIPRPVVNTLVAGLEVDFWWPDARLVVETDGFATHGTRAAFERDRRRDAVLALAGIASHRFTHHQVKREGRFVAQVVLTSLAARR